MPVMIYDERKLEILRYKQDGSSQLGLNEHTPDWPMGHDSLQL